MTYQPGDRVKLAHPTRYDPVGSHPYEIADSDACHYYVIDVTNNYSYRVRLDAVVPWPGVQYGTV